MVCAHTLSRAFARAAVLLPNLNVHVLPHCMWGCFRRLTASEIKPDAATGTSMSMVK